MMNREARASQYKKEPFARELNKLQDSKQPKVCGDVMRCSLGAMNSAIRICSARDSDRLVDGNLISLSHCGLVLPFYIITTKMFIDSN